MEHYRDMSEKRPLELGEDRDHGNNVTAISEAVSPQEAKPVTITATTDLPSPPVNAMGIRQNTVGSVMLTGIPIVSLVIDGGERLCLAQISNTLLKDYSYNEIHNRRVALGITCVQCTPVQLEILRRAGAMPISSRRCGMITKREAERLVKSFLEDIRPPKLPENFAFEVIHDCGWGCRGSFMPSRYNSSRAKCIKCNFCQMYFSPNKFIFHFHRTPDAKYQHPDAANFNSWRRHLCLADPSSSDDLTHAWEDVKAMFNGGSRKRVLCPISSPSSTSHSSQRSTSAPSQPSPGSQYGKRPKLDLDSPGGCSPPSLPPPPVPYPLFPTPNKIPSNKPPHPAFNVPYGYEKPHSPDAMNAVTASPWPAVPETYYPPYEMIWAKHLGLTTPESGFVPHPIPRENPNGKLDSLASSSENDMRHTKVISPNGMEDNDYSYSTGGKFIPNFPSVREKHHLSAFTPVGSHIIAPLMSETIHTETEAMRPSSAGSEDSHKISVIKDSSRGDSLGMEPIKYPETKEDKEEETYIKDSDMDENVDVDTVDDETMEENNNNLRAEKARETLVIDTAENELEQPHNSPCSDQAEDLTIKATLVEVESNTCDQPEAPPVLSSPGQPRALSPEVVSHQPRALSPEAVSHQPSPPVISPEPSTEKPQTKNECQTQPNLGKDLENLSKAQLQEELLQVLEARQKLEKDCKLIQENFSEQVRRELAYREEMAQQLHIVRETLCQELDQERKARFTLQQKLKEAHDALHSFSCKMLASRQCDECAYKEPVMPR